MLDAQDICSVREGVFEANHVNLWLCIDAKCDGDFVLSITNDSASESKMGYFLVADTICSFESLRHTNELRLLQRRLFNVICRGAKRPVTRARPERGLRKCSNKALFCVEKVHRILLEAILQEYSDIPSGTKC